MRSIQRPVAPHQPHATAAEPIAGTGSHDRVVRGERLLADEVKVRPARRPWRAERRRHRTGTGSATCRRTIVPRAVASSAAAAAAGRRTRRRRRQQCMRQPVPESHEGVGEQAVRARVGVAVHGAVPVRERVHMHGARESHAHAGVRSMSMSMSMSHARVHVHVQRVGVAMAAAYSRFVHSRDRSSSYATYARPYASAIARRACLAAVCFDLRGSWHRPVIEPKARETQQWPSYNRMAVVGERESTDRTSTSVAAAIASCASAALALMAAALVLNSSAVEALCAAL